MIKKIRMDCNYFAVRKNYYYVYMPEAVTWDINFMEIKFEKYDKWIFFRWTNHKNRDIFICKVGSLLLQNRS